MYLTAILTTLAAWFAGLVLDANLGFEPQGFLCLRILLPVLAMGCCVIKASGDKANKAE